MIRQCTDLSYSQWSNLLLLRTVADRPHIARGIGFDVYELIRVQRLDWKSLVPECRLLSLRDRLRKRWWIESEDAPSDRRTSEKF